MKISVHCMIKNEQNFLWYAVSSIIDYVDEVLLWDTGSTDATSRIIDVLAEKYRNKIKIKKGNGVTSETFYKTRQQMLDQTSSDWFIMLDGDEIWWDKSIQLLVNAIQKEGRHLESIVVPTVNLVGDIYHHQSEKSGLYHLAGRVGHLNLRAVNRKIPGLHSYGIHGQWGWVDKENKMIQDREQSKVKFVNAPYLHATFLQRAATRKDDQKVPKRKKKLKYDLGVSFPPDYFYPEVFFKNRPEIVSSVWVKRTNYYVFKAAFESPLKAVKNRLISPKVGY